MRKYLLFFFIISYYLSNAQLFSNADKENKILAEKIIKKYRDTHDILILKKFRDEQNNVSLKNYNETSAIISNLLLASLYRENVKTPHLNTIKLFQESISLAKKSNYKNLEIYSNLAYCYYLYRFREIEKSLPIMLRVKNDIENIDENLIIDLANTYKKVGFYFNTLGEYDESNVYLLKAEKNSKDNLVELGSILDNIGMNYIHLNNYHEANTYFEKAIKVANVAKDEIRYAKILGNQALLNQKQKKFDTAINLLNKDILLSTKHKDDQNTMYALALLGKIHLEKNNILEAETVLKKAEVIAISNDNFKSSEYEITKLLLKVAENKGDVDFELQTRRKLEHLKDFINLTDGPESIKRANWTAQKDKLQKTLLEEQKKYNAENLKKKISVISIIVLLVFIVFIVYFTRKKQKKDNFEYEKRISALLQEKNNSESQLNETNKTLKNYSTYLYEKQQQVEKLEYELDCITDSRSPKMEKRKTEIKELLKSHLMTEENWENFKKAFETEYPEIYEHLLNNFENLTDSNLRLVILMSLKLSNNQISNLLGITVDGVKKAKQRLKKKLDNQYEYLFVESSKIV